MKILTGKLLLIAGLQMASCAAFAQVRIRMRAPGRGKSLPAHEVIAQQKERAAEAISFRIKPGKTAETRKELDTRFYVPWSRSRSLYYSDFLNNKKLYNKFLAASDTDLAAVIYPDYRAFYQKLNERVVAEGLAEGSWNAKIEQALNYNYDSLDEFRAPVLVDDSGYLAALTIDSPAASVVNLYPVIYPVNENTWYFNITALFNKYESWLIIKSKDIVDHEQIHFDIYELFARKMRKAMVDNLRRNFAEDNMAGAQNELNAEFEQLYQQMTDKHLEFDHETMQFTAVNAPLQKTNARWRAELRQEIELLKDYEVPEGYVYLK